MSPRHPSSLRAVALLGAVTGLLVLTGCSAVEDAGRQAGDAASQAASDAASQAVEDLSDATVGQVQDQACQIVSDGQVTAQESQVLQDLLDAGERVGLPTTVTDELRGVANAGDQAPADAVEGLRADVCPS